MIQDTSRLAYRTEVKPTLSSRQAAVLAALGDEAMTNRELKERLDWEINTVTPRINELVKAGRVEIAGRRACGITGRTAIAWRAVKKDTLF